MPYRRISAIAALLSALALPFPTQAAYWSPHVGADYKYWGLQPNVYYRDVFPRVNSTLNFYFGTRINGYFGADLGYEETERRELGKEYIGDGTERPFAQLELPQAASTTDVRLRSVHLDLNFYWNVFRRVEVIFMAGIAFVHPSIHISHLTEGEWIEFRGKARVKNMGRVGIGLQYDVLPCWGIKAGINWDPDKRISFIGFDQDDVAFEIHPYATSASYSLGFVYSFSKPRRHQVVVYKDIYELDP